MSDENTGSPAPEAAPVAISEPPQAAKAVEADPKLEIAAKYERAMRKLRQQHEAEKKAWEAEKANYIPKSRFKEDSIGALAEVDLDYQKLTETVLNQPNLNDPTIRAMQARIKAMEEAETGRQKQAQEAQQRQYEQAKKQMLNDVKLATNGAADYELIDKWGAHDSVVELIEETFNSEGYVMDVQAACKAVEEQLLNEALKIYEATKLKDRLKPKEPEAQATAETVVKPKQSQLNVTPKQLNTLTNRITQDNSQRTSEKERRARAIAAMKGELK